MEAFIANQMKPYRNTYEDKLPDYLESPRQASVLTPLKQWLAA